MMSLAGWMVAMGMVGTEMLAAQGPTSQSREAGHPVSAAAAKRPMTFADLMAMKRVSDPQISPSGKWVMFSVTEVSLEKNTKVNHLWVVALRAAGEPNPTIGSGKPSPIMGHPNGERQVTFGDGESNGRFSPDGKTVSLTMKDQIFEMPWDEAAGMVGAAVQVTNVAGEADGAIWSPDSRRLMFVASVYPECSVKGGKQVTARTEAGPSASPQDDNFKRGSGGATPSVWEVEDACDKARDEAAAKSPVKAQVWDGLLYRHWDHYTGEKRSHVLVVNADGGGVRDLTPASVVGDAETPTFSLGGPLGYAWAPDSKEIAYVTNLDKVPAASTNNDVFTLRLDEAGAKAVKVSTSPGSDDGPAYSPDGKWLAFRSQARAGYESDRFRLMVFDREKKTISEINPQYDEWIDEFSWGPESNVILFTSADKGESPIRVVAIQEHMPAIGKNPAFHEMRSRSEVGEFGDLHLTSDYGIIGTRMLANDPAAIFWIQTLPADSLGNPPQQPEIQVLTHLNNSVLAQVDLAPMESYWFAGAGGTQIQGFIIRPPNFDPAKKYPVKFLIHGGPQGAWGDAWSYRWNAELMAASGYVVVMVNPRGSTGYGQKFVEGVSGDWGGKPYIDLMRGLDAAEAKFPFIDKTRECALGASYGGFMANWILTHTNRFQCIVTHDGMYDPVSAYGDTEEMWFNEWEFRRAEDFPGGAGPHEPTSQKADGVHGGKTNTGILTGGQNDGLGNDGVKGGGRPAQPWRYASLPADEDPFRKWSPMLHIQNAKTPTLVIHSQKDYRLDVSQGLALFTALQRLNVPSKMLYFPDEGHWVLKPQNSQLWNEVVGDWCDKWTKTGKYAGTNAN